MTIYINTILSSAKQSLAAVSESAALDAELLLLASCPSLKTRADIYAYPERKISFRQKQKFEKLLTRRLLGEPIAYILDYQEFWSLKLKVSENVLIPRPETELLVECILKTFPADKKIKVLDLGTGSGAIPIALSTERPKWEIVALDNSEVALKIAKWNAKNLNCKNINFLCSDWFSHVKGKFDVISANPPYIEENEKWLNDKKLAFEPKSALFAGLDGLKDLRIIIENAKNFLVKGGMLFLEHGFNQAQSVTSLMQEAGYDNVTTICDLANHPRVSYGNF